MLSQNFRDRHFELRHHVGGDLVCETPFAAAIDFRRLPRWSMAAAAITPFSLESAFRCLIFPSESCICLLRAPRSSQYNEGTRRQ